MLLARLGDLAGRLLGPLPLVACARACPLGPPAHSLGAALVAAGAFVLGVLVLLRRKVLVEVGGPFVELLRVLVRRDRPLVRALRALLRVVGVYGAYEESVARTAAS